MNNNSAYTIQFLENLIRPLDLSGWLISITQFTFCDILS